MLHLNRTDTLAAPRGFTFEKEKDAWSAANVRSSRPTFLPWINQSMAFMHAHGARPI
jgi:hypothetical protein